MKLSGNYIQFDIQTFVNKDKVACFDYDHTLVAPHKGTFSRNVDDWVFIRPNVPDIVQKYCDEGYCIVIFTNQTFEFKVEQIKIAMESLNIPMRVYVGISDEYRKPSRAMWDKFNNDKIISEDSFFVGDALGRNGDWSDSDAVFAKNIGISLRTPEEVFPFENTIVSSFTPSDSQELVLMMGYPGSGKTTFVNNHIPGEYSKIHGDDATLKTDAKRKKAVKLNLEEGKSVVLDVTNPSLEKRKQYIDIAQELGIPIRLVHISSNFDLSKYRNSLRENKVPIMALYMYRKKFAEPSINEGYSDIIIC